MTDNSFDIQSKAHFLMLVDMMQSLNEEAAFPGTPVITKQELANAMLQVTKFDLGEYPDYETTESCVTEDSDLVERLKFDLNKILRLINSQESLSK